MPKRSSKDSDLNVTAFQIVQAATGQATKKEEKEKNPAAVALGKLGGKKGGKARAESLTAEQRHRIAQNAAKARWSRRK